MEIEIETASRNRNRNRNRGWRPRVEIEIEIRFQIEIEIEIAPARGCSTLVHGREAGCAARQVVTSSRAWGGEEAKLRYVLTPVSPIDDRSSGEALKGVMDELGMTVRELSERTGLSSRTITALRSGRSQGNFATWRAISKVTGRSVDELTGAL